MRTQDQGLSLSLWYLPLNFVIAQYLLKPSNDFHKHHSNVPPSELKCLLRQGLLVFYNSKWKELLRYMGIYHMTSRLEAI